VAVPTTVVPRRISALVAVGGAMICNTSAGLGSKCGSRIAMSECPGSPSTPAPVGWLRAFGGLDVSKANVAYGPPPSAVNAITVTIEPVPEPPPLGSFTV
jgi:hypothetical protein